MVCRTPDFLRAEADKDTIRLRDIARWGVRGGARTRSRSSSVGFEVGSISTIWCSNAFAGSWIPTGTRSFARLLTGQDTIVDGMSFFPELPEPEPDLEPEPFEEPERPEWFGPTPGAFLPGISSERLVLFHTSEAVMVIDRFQGYPNGLMCEISTFVRRPMGPGGMPPWGFEHRDPWDSFEPNNALRLGVLFSDGSKWNNIDQADVGLSIDDAEPPGIVFTAQGGSSNPTGWQFDYWLWPLPPPGLLTFVVAWPVHGIDETMVSIDTAPLLQAASEATPLWPKRLDG